jgi:hypothetical protein
LIAAPCVLRSSGDILPSVDEQRGDRTLLAERRDAHGFERGFVAAAAMSARIWDSSGKVGHGNPF